MPPRAKIPSDHYVQVSAHHGSKGKGKQGKQNLARLQATQQALAYQSQKPKQRSQKNSKGSRPRANSAPLRTPKPKPLFGSSKKKNITEAGVIDLGFINSNRGVLFSGNKMRSDFNYIGKEIIYKSIMNYLTIYF